MARANGADPSGIGIDAEHQVVHDRVADQSDLVDVHRFEAGLVGEAKHERPQGRSHGAGHLERATFVHHRVRDAAHEVLAEADLRVHDARRGQHRAVAEVGEMAGDRRRADVDGDAVRLLVEARPDRRHVPPVVDRDGDRIAALLERRLERADDVEVGGQAGQVPLALEGVEEAHQVSRRRGELWWRDLDVVEADDRVDDEVADRQALADDLAVDLAVGRDVDDHVAAQMGRTRQPAALGEPLLAVVLGFALRRRGQVVGAGGDAVLGEAIRTTARPGSDRTGHARHRPSRCRRPASGRRRGPSSPPRTGRVARTA